MNVNKLKDGMLITFRNGNKGVCLEGYIHTIMYTSIPINDYNDTLEYKHGSSFDIMKVWLPTKTHKMCLWKRVPTLKLDTGKYGG